MIATAMAWATGLGIWYKLAGVVVAVGLVVISYKVWEHRVYNQGYQAAIDEIREEARERTNAATKAVERYHECMARGGVWDQSTGFCAGGM